MDACSKKRKIIFVFCGLGLLGFGLVLLPNIRNFVIWLTENIYLRRQLEDHAKWHNKMIVWSIRGTVIFLFILCCTIFWRHVKNLAFLAIEYTKQIIKPTKKLYELMNIKHTKHLKYIYQYIFIIATTVLFLVFAIKLMDNPYGLQRYLFSFALHDYLADFLQILRYVAERDPYFNTINGVGQKIYLPLSYLILYPFSKLDNFAEMSSLQEAWNSKLGNFSAFSFMGFCIFLLMYSLNVIRKKYSLSPFILIGIVLSFYFIQSIERANIIFLSAACTGLFIAFYDSESRKDKIIAIIAIALAVTLKIYPVLFGFLYLEKKQYKEIIASALLTIFLIFVPFLFFKRGFDNIPQLIENIRLNAEHYHYKAHFCFNLRYLSYDFFIKLNFSSGKVEFFTNISQVILILISVFSIVFSILINNRWLKIALLTMTILFLPVFSVWYCGLYMFPLIILFFGTVEERSKIFNYYTLIVFIICLCPLIININYKNTAINLNSYAINISLLIFWFAVFIISIKQIIKKFQKKRLPTMTQKLMEA